MEILNQTTAPIDRTQLATAAARPIRIVQFGEGNFLRAFVDWAVQQMNDRGNFDGNVALVQPLEQGRVNDIAAQDNLYTVILEGLRNGSPVQEHDIIDSIGTTLNPYTQWEDYLALADNPDTRIIISNTTEAGIAIDEHDSPTAQPPASYPAKLLLLLKRRYDNQLPGFLILPCELIEDNGVHLRECLVATAQRFGYDQDFINWLVEDNTFYNTLVDRIVPGYPADRATELCNELGYRDNNMVKAEPFGLWVIAGDEDARRELFATLPIDSVNMNIVVTDDVRPYRERKVSLLNAPHTTMALIARLLNFTTVGQVMNDGAMRSFIEREMHEEIIPVLSLPTDELNDFANTVLERFANPFVQHELDSIALNSVAKFTARILPILHANVDSGRGLPPRIVLALSALIATYAGLAPTQATVQDTPAATARLATVTNDGQSIAQALADTSLWGEDLTAIPGLAAAVTADIQAIAAGDLTVLEVSLAA